ncbi:HAMP domain-containing protein [Cohnella sp. CFH 77786]|uniref:sensor histidine kinase n=1 Tax=Cohnella sp. CFH 77786 TaxID=2662265 RepID=UPI001C60BA64|nr:sensor histidine kinase [Cohnella sp. CFH 77786]MBW5445734.1 HAMP domain-containing protein [Cohnella sp. CFH 77786]
MLSRLWSSVRRSVADLKIRNKLFAAFLLLNMLPLAAIGALTYQKSSSLLQERTNDYTADLLSEVSRNIELTLREIDSLYYSIFTNELIRTNLSRANKGLMSEGEYFSASYKTFSILQSYVLDREDVQAVNVYALDKKFLFQAGEYPMYVPLTRKEWDRIERNKGNLVWFRPENERSVVAAASSIYDTDTLRKSGYFVLGFKEDALLAIYSRIKLHDQGELFMVDGGGQIISHRDKSRIGTRLEAPYLDPVRTASGSSGNFSAQADGREQIVSFHEIGDTDWKLVSVIPAAQYSSLSLLLRNWMIAVFAAVSALALILSYLLSNNISKPIRRLSAMMKSVERDNWDVQSDYRSRSEIGILSRNFNRMIGRIRYLIHQVYQEELLKQRTQLKYLMFQINPHFLFNTLETINWVARIQGAPEVGKLSKALGDLMREGIKGKEFVPFERELANLKNYLYIQKYRYDDKIEVRFEIAGEVLGAAVPRFILQPLVENAMVHGMETKMGRGTIEIQAELSGETLKITVRDDGLGIEPRRLAEIRASLETVSEDDAHGIGLTNVHRRIRLHYGAEYGLTIDSSTGAGTAVRLTLPKKSEISTAKSESSHREMPEATLR